MQLQFVETDTGHSPFSTIGRALEDKALDIIAAVKQQQERTWHPRMIADVQLPESFGEPYAAVISLQKQGGVEQTRLSGLQVGGTHPLPESARSTATGSGCPFHDPTQTLQGATGSCRPHRPGMSAVHGAKVMHRMPIRLQPQAALPTNLPSLPLQLMYECRLPHAADRQA